MQTKLLIAFTTVFISIILLSNTTKVSSTGVPIGSTGAPEESTCAKSGCHTGNNNLNSGIGKLSIEIPELEDNYIPEKNYSVTVTLKQDSINRFGFAFMAYNQNTKNSAGNLLVSDPTRTQVLAGANEFENRDYMTYKAMGTNPYSKNTGQWTFNWQAPKTPNLPITFYIATVAANNDGTDEGDEVYTHSIALNNNSTKNKNIFKKDKISISPNPIEKNFQLSFENTENSETKVSLISANGNNVYSLYNSFLTKGYQTLNLEKPLNIASGIYFLSVQQKNNQYTKKIIVQ